MTTSWKARWRERATKIGPPIVILLSTVFFARHYGEHYPIEEWLFWRYAGYWISCAFWSLGCVSSGYALVRRLRGSPLPLAETLCLSFAAGVVLFYVSMNALAMVGAFRWPLFFLLPAFMIAVGLTPLYRLVSRYRRHLRHRAKERQPRSRLELVIWIFGIAVVAMIYFKILTPENAQFDARWKHLALAEQYAHVGTIPRFGEGWTVATNPHLASILFTWAFLLPKATLFDQIELAAHMEFTCFLWTLATIPAAVRLLVPNSRASATWVARLLFPGVLLYDSSLACGADHIAALFALPVFICMLRALRHLPPGRCALLALMMAGAAMPKLTAGVLLAPVAILAVAGTVVWRAIGWRTQRRFQWQGPLAAAAVALAATSPFWLRNWVWYGDPLYPSLHEHLALRPWSQDAAALFEWGYKDFQFWRPSRDWAGLQETVETLFTFSFIPHDYARYHGKVPVFGSLFTLLVLCLPFLRKTKRIWALAGMTHLAIFLWFWIHHQDRYLQTLVPWMAAVTAAIMIHLWRTHVVARILLGSLVATQIIIGGNVYFIPSHAMIKSPVKKSLDLLAAGHKKRYGARLSVCAGWQKVRAALPKRAHVMLHDNHTHLGLARRTTSDWGGWQFGISYGRLKSPRQVWELYRELGVTHLVWRDRVSKGWDSVAGDLVFFDFATRRSTGRKKVGSTWIATMPGKPPTDEPFGKVAFFGCKDMYKPGLYPLEGMTTPVFGPDRRHFPKPEEQAKKGQEQALIDQASYVVIDPRCGRHAEKKVKQNGAFSLAASRKLVNSGRRRKGKANWLLYLRTD